MPYLGKTPAHGNYSKIDDISGSFDGSDATHPLASSSLAITPVRPEALLISINGVIQEPVTDYTVSGTNITFTTAPAATDSFFGVALGEQLAIGTPSDGTVTSAKLSGDLTLPGNLTIGDASAADAKLVFDGNAQDYHLGLDDTADDLVIGLGSTLGTTTHMAFDETGAIIKPLQPCFSVAATTLNNLAVGSAETIAWGSERFDLNADFSSNTFTAPVGGKYLLSFFISIFTIDSASNYYNVNLITSNYTYEFLWDPDFGQDNIYENYAGTVVADMDASDTAYTTIKQQSGTAQTDFGANSHFMGCLLA